MTTRSHQTTNTSKQPVSTAPAQGMFQSRPFEVRSDSTTKSQQQLDLKTSLMQAERYGHHLSRIHPAGVSAPQAVQPKRVMQLTVQGDRLEKPSLQEQLKEESAQVRSEQKAQEKPDKLTQKALLQPSSNFYSSKQGVVQCTTVRVRPSTRNQTNQSLSRRRRRTTNNSRNRPYTSSQNPQASVPSDYSSNPNLRGTYGQQRLMGGRVINRRRQTRLATEADHIPTDGSQRGNLSRNDSRNRQPMLNRPAASVPTGLHRLHPTTSGGRNYDGGEMARAQRVLNQGYPHVGTNNEALQRGRHASIELHLDGYRQNMPTYRYAPGVYNGIRFNMNDMLQQHVRQGNINGQQAQNLNQQVAQIFR